MNFFYNALICLQFFIFADHFAYATAPSSPSTSVDASAKSPSATLKAPSTDVVVVSPYRRIASAYVSQDFINEQIKAHMKSELIKEMKVVLDPTHGHIFLRGVLHIPVEEMRAINLDPKLGAFRFQLTIKPETTRQGYLVLEFPLSETFFYPAESTDPDADRVIVPVQMISMALASARGYLATLSGDFTRFDKRTEKLKMSLKVLEHEIKKEKKPELLEELKNQRDALKIQLAAVPIERKQLEKMAKEVEHLMGFTGEKELNLNEELAARKNTIILKIQLSQLTPYLTGVELGGVRILHDKKDGNGENYLAIDIDSTLAEPPPLTTTVTKNTSTAEREKLKVAPSFIMRIKQSLLESSAVINAENKKMTDKIKNFKIELKDDGLHVAGEFKTFLVTVPFETVVDLVTTGLDTFEVRVRELEVAGLDLEFLTSFILEAIEKRLDSMLKGICTFKYLGTESDESRALQVTVNPKTLVPAFPDLHLINIDVREGEFLLKIGHP